VIVSQVELDVLLRNDLSTFIERAFVELNPETELAWSKHIEVMAAKLEACRRGEIRRLIVNLPPRSLKSHCVSVAFPAFVLGHNPSAQVICASYGQDLSDKLARDCRTLMASKFYRNVFPKTRLSQDKQSINDFMTTAQGFRMSTSIGGVLTGRGGDIIILDDPLKPDDALSEVRRNAVNNWYDNSLLSRLNNKRTGVIILVMQRLHQDDLVGHVQEQGDWEVLSFPAIAEEDETFEYETIFGTKHYMRKSGEPLQPEREDLETLARIKRQINEYNFASQYQQNPMPAGGAMVKAAWLKYYTEPPQRFSLVVQSWDTANKSGDLNDYSVCTTWGVLNRCFYVLDVFRSRLNYPDLRRAVKSQAQIFKPTTILIEDKASGTQLIQDLQRDGVLSIHPYEPPTGTDKIMRFHAQTAEFENGRVLLPKEAAWLSIYTQELISFPGSKYDDQIDSTSQALDYLKGWSNLDVWMRL
jgi:predicted phage terminase large subunit-like protein